MVTGYTESSVGFDPASNRLPFGFHLASIWISIWIRQGHQETFSYLQVRLYRFLPLADTC